MYIEAAVCRAQAFPRQTYPVASFTACGATRSRRGSHASMSAIKIQRVALPKGVTPKCEICGEPAEYRCSKCPTHYCTVRHFDIDWKGILHLIYQDVAALAERPAAGTEKEREKRKQESAALQSKILAVSGATAKAWINKGEYQLAVAGALYALKMAERLYGHQAVEAVPAYLLLAEIYLELEQLSSASDLLTLASWSLFKNSGNHDALRPLLYRNFGRLYSAQNRCDEALKACAMDVYCSTETYGPDAFETALSYYYMARAFDKSTRPMRCAFRFYGQVCNIYLSWFEETERQAGPAITATEPPSVNDKERTSQSSNRVLKRRDVEGDIGIDEAIKITRQIQRHTENALGAQHKLANVALLANAVLLASIGNYEEAVSQLNHASARIEKAFGSDHALGSRCQAYMEAVKRRQTKS